MIQTKCVPDTRTRQVGGSGSGGGGVGGGGGGRVIMSSLCLGQ